jgi:hypothetical protein
LGFPTGWSSTTHKDVCSTSTWHHQFFSGAITTVSSFFSSAVAGEERRLLRGEFFAHTFFTLLFVLLYFIYLPALLFISKTQKN